MSKLNKPIIFAFTILPIAIVATIFTTLYQFDMFSQEVLEQAIRQVGSMEMIILISVIQTMFLAFSCSFFGYILATRMGLWKPFKIEKSKVLLTVVMSVGFGILFSLDYWTFGNAIVGIKDATAASLTLNGVIASILYGGVIEEILLRLFFMSFIAFIVWKVFFKKYEPTKVPNKVFIIANVIAAIAFAAGHLPATITTFGGLTFLIVFRCFLLNGGFGLFFGWLYRKYGIWYAILAHILLHVVSKAIWFIFI